ncbi:MAG: DUF4214 domain-containing protein [Acidimicrobiia bacterium]|nr:DUF4214 domain-containing protein [Acidimicrobiia bacterium]
MRAPIVVVVLLSPFLVAGPVLAQTVPPASGGDDPPSVEFEMVANLDELTEQHATLFRLYWAFFLREPDGEGALYWIERQERCDGLGAIADEFAAGREFANRYGDLDDESFVEQIYRNVLGRRGEAAGLEYWTDLVVGEELSRGEMVLHVSQSIEFRAKHPYPSDHVPGRGCRLPAGTTPTARTFVEAVGDRLASVRVGANASGPAADIPIVAPAAVIEHAGFHQSMHPGAQGMVPAPDGSTEVPLVTMASRNRDTHLAGAIDIAVHPLVPITAPVTGTVARAGNYVLYCRYRDGYVVINPDIRPDLEVKVFHIQDVMARAGQRVTVGDKIAARATPFPFRSQIDGFTAEPSWPHVHIETIDLSIPRRPSSSGGC